MVERKKISRGGGADISSNDTPNILSGKHVANAKMAEKIQMLATWDQ
jgi:hypothetical protein